MLMGGALDIAFAESITQRRRVSTPELPLLSVIIVAYKSRDEIGACVESLPRRLALPDGTAGAVEVIVIDNSAAGDGTNGTQGTIGTAGEDVREIVRRDFPWVDYVAAETNLGFGRANNRGFARAWGEFILFLNPDTVSNAEALAHCIARLRADRRIGLITPRLELADGTMDLACRRSVPTLWDGFCRASGLAAAFPRAAFVSGYNLTHLPEDGTYQVGAINGAFMLAPRDVLTRVAVAGAVFDEAFFMYGDDLDLCIRVARAGWKIVYDGRVRITHLKGVSVAKDYDAMARAIFDANREVYLKHFGGSAVARWKYRAAFGAWKWIALARARWRGHRRVRPL
jgi:GT2 family glycosyltransferase